MLATYTYLLSGVNVSMADYYVEAAFLRLGRQSRNSDQLATIRDKFDLRILS